MGGALQHWDLERLIYSYELYVRLTYVFDLGSEKKKKKRKSMYHSSESFICVLGCELMEVCCTYI